MSWIAYRYVSSWISKIRVDVKHEIKDLKDFKALRGYRLCDPLGLLRMRCVWRHDLDTVSGLSGTQIQYRDGSNRCSECDLEYTEDSSLCCCGSRVLGAVWCN
jgi:hypothetical protein